MVSKQKLNRKKLIKEDFTQSFFNREQRPYLSLNSTDTTGGRFLRVGRCELVENTGGYYGRKLINGMYGAERVISLACKYFSL